MMTKERTVGHITQVVGVVIDVEFSDKNLPAMYDALEITQGDKTITLEVAQHLDERTVRTIALSSTDGLKRGDDVIATGAPITVPVGDATQGRMFNVVGEPIDNKPAPKAKRSPIHREPPALHQLLQPNPLRGIVLRDEHAVRFLSVRAGGHTVNYNMINMPSVRHCRPRRRPGAQGLASTSS